MAAPPAMAARVIWAEALDDLRPWIPGSAWKASRAVFFRAETVCGTYACGLAVEPDSPLQLGMNRGIRRPKTLDTPVLVHHAPQQLVPGEVYMMRGTLSPVLRDGHWEFVAPRGGSSVGTFSILGWTAQVECKPAVDSRECHGRDICGFFEVTGRFRSCMPPQSDTTMQEWLEQYTDLLLQDTWISCNGRWVEPQSFLRQGESVLVRLCQRLRGGGPSGGKHAADDLGKLRKHLALKGVPDEMLDQRVAQVQAVVSAAELSAVYQSLDPWPQLKAAVNQRMRLVTPEEMRKQKACNKSGGSSSAAPDPWELNDPWKEGRRASFNVTTQPSELEPLIELIPEFFCCEDGSHPQVLQHVFKGCTGICLLPTEEAEMLCSLGQSVSADECGVIVVGTVPPQTGAWPCAALTFVAKHADAGKILIKGFLVNLGDKQITIASQDEVLVMPSKDSQALTVEIPKKHADDWPAVQQNGLRYAWKCIAGLQNASLGTWSRKYFKGKQVTAAQESTSFHAFVRVLSGEVLHLLQASGSGGVFLTPKSKDATGPSTEFKVVWGGSDDLSKALLVARTNAAIFGVVRGRDCLGWRVKVKDYVAVRKAIEPQWEVNSNLRYDVSISRKFIVAPLPQDIDRESMQQLLSSFLWEAVPLRQVNTVTWVVGSDQDPPNDVLHLEGSIALIREEKPRAKSKPESTIVSAPTSMKHRLEQQFRHYVAPAKTLQRTVSPALPLPAKPSAGPNQLQVDALRQELEERLSAVNMQMTQTVSQMQSDIQQTRDEARQASAVATQHVAELREEFQQQHHRVECIEKGIQDLTLNTCTKADLSAVLAEALAQQSNELRGWLAKRSPDPSPANESSKSKVPKHE